MPYLDELIDGYHRFRAQDWSRERRPFWAVIPLAAEQLTLVGREDESESDDE